MSRIKKILSELKQQIIKHQSENMKASEIEDEDARTKALAERATIMEVWLLGVDTQLSNLLYDLHIKEQQEKQALLSTPKRVLGTVDFNSGSVVVSDPCYKPGTWCQHVLSDVKKGTWLTTKKLSDEGEWGIRISELEAYIGTPPTDSDFELVEGADIGVDSGQAGFFDQAGYANTSLLAGTDYSMYSSVGPKDTDPEEKQQADTFYAVCCDLTLSSEHAGVFAGGVVSSSGFGDGSYDLHVRRENDEVTAMRLVFIGDEEDE